MFEFSAVCATQSVKRRVGAAFSKIGKEEEKKKNKDGNGCSPC